MKNIKTFNTESEYQSYITGGTAVLPNLSYVKGTDEVHTTRIPSLTATIDVTQTTGATKILCIGVSKVSSIIIDDEKMEPMATGYTFSTIGEHKVKYILKDNKIPDGMFYRDGGAVRVTSVRMSNSINEIGEYAFYSCRELIDIEIREGITSIGNQAFYECYGLSSITIPNSVTSIGWGAFQSCSGLTNVTIGNGVTTIGEFIFDNCSNLNSIVSLATTAPTISSDTFYNIKTNGTLMVPQGSTGYDVWMGTGDYYLGKYNWTKVEQ
jgi:hypothetical protein